MTPVAPETDDTDMDELDHIQDALRSAAVIYTWAINSRRAMSEFKDEPVRHNLLLSIQSVPLTRWEELPGIYLWIALVAGSGASDDLPGRFTRQKVAVAASSIAFENFPLAISCVRSFWLVQRWIGDTRSHELDDRKDLISSTDDQCNDVHQ
jgi:hypothetical protein